jgi:transcription termination/antitermination protein NusG
MSRCPESSLPWFAVYVKNRHEKNVALSLRGKGYESFLPTYVKLDRDYKKYDLPLFPGYVFCRFEVQNTLPVVSIPGVFSIVANGPKPSAICETEIDAIKRMLASQLVVQPWPYIAAGQQISMKSGPLRGLEGVVIDETHHQWLVLSLHLLQRSVAVKVDRVYLE